MKIKPVTVGAAQGDLLIYRVDSIPKKAKKVEPENGRLIIARGEATGHHHSLPHERGVTLFMDESSKAPLMYFEIETKKSKPLEHQEHHTIPFTKGIFKVEPQRTYQVGMGVSRVVVD
jgi:hypothetical protein